jgi:hypothetical protein
MEAILFGIALAGFFAGPLYLRTMSERAQRLVIGLLASMLIFGSPTLMMVVKMCSTSSAIGAPVSLMDGIEKVLMAILNVVRWFGIPLMVLTIWQFISSIVRGDKTETEEEEVPV